jgi:nucleotide-binding universal stress UspA family protein
MLEKILIATDFSPASDCLVQCAAELKTLGLKKAVLAHVIYVANTPGLEDMLKAEVQSHAERQKKLLEEQGIEVVTAIELGIPARDLNDLAERHDAAAILIGSRGRNLLRSALGSVSFRLLQITNRPVFLARINVLGEGEACSISVCRQSFRCILFATDFSNASERAFGFLETIVRQSKAAVTLLHVLDRQHVEIHLSRGGIEEQEALDRRRLEEMRKRLEALGSEVEIDWLIGLPAEEIVARSKGERFSLVVMGNHGKGFFRAALGSVANEVARRAETPVLFGPDVQ